MPFPFNFNTEYIVLWGDSHAGSDILVKAASGLNKEMDSETLLHARLFPDMFDFIRQVQIAADFAKGVTARLAGQEVPVYEDNETTFDELQARIAKTLQFISTIPAEKIDGSEAREIITRPGTPKEANPLTQRGPPALSTIV